MGWALPTSSGCPGPTHGLGHRQGWDSTAPGGVGASPAPRGGLSPHIRPAGHGPAPARRERRKQPALPQCPSIPEASAHREPEHHKEPAPAPCPQPLPARGAQAPARRPPPPSGSPSEAAILGEGHGLPGGSGRRAPPLEGGSSAGRGGGPGLRRRGRARGAAAGRPAASRRPRGSSSFAPLLPPARWGWGRLSRAVGQRRGEVLNPGSAAAPREERLCAPPHSPRLPDASRPFLKLFLIVSVGSLPRFSPRTTRTKVSTGSRKETLQIRLFLCWHLQQSRAVSG